METKNIIVTSFSKPTSQGVILHFNKPARFIGGTGKFNEIWFSWDKIATALIEDYADYDEILELRKKYLKENTK